MSEENFKEYIESLVADYETGKYLSISHMMREKYGLILMRDQEIFELLMQIIICKNTYEQAVEDMIYDMFTVQRVSY